MHDYSLGQADNEVLVEREESVLVRRDTAGRRLGTTEEEAPGYLVRRDTRGHHEGAVERGASGEWVARVSGSGPFGTSDLAPGMAEPLSFKHFAGGGKMAWSGQEWSWAGHLAPRKCPKMVAKGAGSLAREDDPRTMKLERRLPRSE